MDILWIILFFLAILISIQVYCWQKVHASLHLPHVEHPDTPATYGLMYETKSYKNEKGISLEGWYVPVKNAKAIVIVVHGYRDVKNTVSVHAQYLNKAGYTAFLIDLSSDLPGAKTTLGVEEYKDVVAAYEFMKSMPEHKDKPIGFFGGSMGASACITAAGKTDSGDFIIASVPFANFTSLFIQRIKLEKLPTILLPFVKIANAIELGINYESFAPEKYIKNIKKPLFIIASANDIKVNGHDAYALFQKANEPKDFWKANAQHDVYKDLPEEYARRIVAFLDKMVH